MRLHSTVLENMPQVTQLKSCSYTLSHIMHLRMLEPTLGLQHLLLHMTLPPWNRLTVVIHFLQSSIKGGWTKCSFLESQDLMVTLSSQRWTVSLLTWYELTVITVLDSYLFNDSIVNWILLWYHLVTALFGRPQETPYDGYCQEGLSVT